MIASYFAKVSIATDQAALRKVDRYLKQIEKKMQAFQKKAMKANGAFNIKFHIDEKLLQRTIGNALDRASTRVTMEIRNFHINQAALSAAMRRASAGASVGMGGRGFGGGVSRQEWDRRRAVTQLDQLENMRLRQQSMLESHRQRMELAQFRAQNAPIRASHAMGAGAAAGAFGRYGMMGRYGGPAIVGGAALYGGGALNRANQEAMSMRLTTQAVVQAAGGSEQQGKDAFEWLRNLGNEVGFTYKDAAPEFNQFLANAQGAGLSINQSQDIFQGLSEYQTAMGVTPARRKLVMNAASQMLGKQVVSMEELRRQMAESLPGTMDIFAQAFAEMSGSGLQGPDALQALYEAVPTGTVKSAEILPIVERIMRERAAPKLGVMKKTSIAEQARAQNVMSDMVNVMSSAGMEEGFSRVFRTFREGLQESSWLLEKLASGFNDLTRIIRPLVLWPQDFMRALGGRDSLVADWLGADKTAQLIKDWEAIKLLFKDIMGVETPSWLPTLEATTKEIVAIMGAVAEFQRWYAQFKEVTVPGAERLPFMTHPITSVTQLGVEVVDSFKRAQVRNAVVADPSSPYYKDRAGYEDHQRQMALAAAQDKASGYVENRYSFGDITISVPLSAGMTPEEQGTMIADYFKVRLEEAMQESPQTE